MNCEFCQSPVHIWFQCPKKPDGWKPARLAKDRGQISRSADSAPKSTAVRKADVRRLSPGERDREPDCVVTPAGSSALPVDPPKRGRPSTGFDKRAYNKQYMADRRAGKR